MKYIYTILSILLLSTGISYGQAKKPSIMVRPSDLWCNNNGYVKKYDDQGTIKTIPDYKRAFQENAQLKLAISAINGLMAERSFPLINMEAFMKDLESESAEEAVMTSKSGASVTESPLDKLRKIAKADIIIDLTWTVNTYGPNNQITYIMGGIDSYTSKEVATANGIGQKSFEASVDVMLHAAVLANIDAFSNSLQTHFNDLFDNGREVTIRIRKFSSWDKDLEEEFDGIELSEIIQKWMNENTVKHRNSQSSLSESMMDFTQVRIPLYNASGMPIDAKDFLKGLQKFLKAPPYSIVSKLTSKGLGTATLQLGEK